MARTKKAPQAADPSHSSDSSDPDGASGSSQASNESTTSTISNGSVTADLASGNGFDANANEDAAGFTAENTNTGAAAGTPVKSNVTRRPRVQLTDSEDDDTGGGHKQRNSHLRDLPAGAPADDDVGSGSGTTNNNDENASTDANTESDSNGDDDDIGTPPFMAAPVVVAAPASNGGGLGGDGAGAESTPQVSTVEATAIDPSTAQRPRRPLQLVRVYVRVCLLLSSRGPSQAAGTPRADCDCRSATAVS
jgi:hypothetical protein